MLVLDDPKLKYFGFEKLAGSHKGLSDVDCSEPILGTKECSDHVLDTTDRSRGSKLTLEDPKPEFFGFEKLAVSHKVLRDVDHPVDCSGSILGTKECSDGVLDVADRSGGSQLTLKDPEPKNFGFEKLGASHKVLRSPEKEISRSEGQTRSDDVPEVRDMPDTPIVTLDDTKSTHKGVESVRDEGSKVVDIEGIMGELTDIGYYPDPNETRQAPGRQDQGGRPGQAGRVHPRTFALISSIYTALSCMSRGIIQTTAETAYRASSCLDSGATVDVLGRDHCEGASNIVDVDLELGTASDTVRIKQTGDCMVEPGIEVQQGWMAPWLDMTLISLTKRLSEGYRFAASGMHAVLVSPTEKVYRFIVRDGLIVPDDSDGGPGRNNIQMPCPYRCKHCRAKEAGTRDQAYLSEEVYEQGDVEYRAGQGKDILSDKGVAIGSALAVAMAVLNMYVGGLSVPVEVLTQIVPVLAAAQKLVQAGGASRKRIPGKRVRVTHSRVASLEHNKKGHNPHDPHCEVCRMSRMRAKQAKARGTDATVTDSDKGYVLGVDFFGPFDPDVDGYIYGMIGVEVAHTKYGMVELARTREAKEARDGLLQMMRDIKYAGPDPKEVARVHTDDDTSFKGEFKQELLDRQIRQTNTGGYRPTNNSCTERRIGLLLSTLRAVLYTATGGSRMYDALWGPALRHANSMVNKSIWSDGTSPHTSRVGEGYQLSDDDHVFGAKVIHWVPKEKRDLKWVTPGQEGIWVGRSQVVTGGHLVVPIKWDGGGKRYELGPTIVATRVEVDDETYPLRMGPVDKGDIEGCDAFMDKFHHTMYGETEDMEDWQVEGEDPILQVESIASKKGKGKKTQYLVKWCDSDVKTWEPIKHLQGCKEAIQTYEASVRKGKGKLAFDYTHKAYIVVPLSEDEQAVAELIVKERVQGSVGDWVQGYRSELDAVTRRRLIPVDPTADPTVDAHQ